MKRMCCQSRAAPFWSVDGGMDTKSGVPVLPGKNTKKHARVGISRYATTCADKSLVVDKVFNKRFKTRFVEDLQAIAVAQRSWADPRIGGDTALSRFF